MAVVGTAVAVEAGIVVVVGTGTAIAVDKGLRLGVENSRWG